MKTIFSGIQPSGAVHIGNYIGAMKLWVGMQDTLGEDDTFIFMMADLHTITVPQEPGAVKKNSLELTAWYLAAGLDPEKVSLFIQSQNPDHPYAAWIFDCVTPMGWMERMTQYKEKSDKQGERTSVGLFHYPSLMAADILLYNTDVVPVGDDQTQHLELTRDVAEKFNKQFGETFKIPNILLQEHGARIMSLQDPSSKMSKSDDNQHAMIGLLDDADTIRKKVMKAVTDSGDDIRAGEDKPALTNLLSIYSIFSGESIESIEGKYEGKGYGDFKKDLAEVLITELEPIRNKYNEIISDTGYIQDVLQKGLDTARSISSKKVDEIREAVGFLM